MINKAEELQEGVKSRVSNLLMFLELMYTFILLKTPDLLKQQL